MMKGRLADGRGLLVSLLWPNAQHCWRKCRSSDQVGSYLRPVFSSCCICGGVSRIHLATGEKGRWKRCVPGQAKTSLTGLL